LAEEIRHITHASKAALMSAGRIHWRFKSMEPTAEITSGAPKLLASAMPAYLS
jgi:hypothetical protein